METNNIFIRFVGISFWPKTNSARSLIQFEILLFGNVYIIVSQNIFPNTLTSRRKILQTRLHTCSHMARKRQAENVWFLFTVPRNYDPSLHPFEAPREYVRALNATKLERVFAKPFIGSLDGHRDGVHSLAKHPTRLSMLLSGACDGEVSLMSVIFSTIFRVKIWPNLFSNETSN